MTARFLDYESGHLWDCKTGLLSQKDFDFAFKDIFYSKTYFEDIINLENDKDKILQTLSQPVYIKPLNLEHFNVEDNQPHLFEANHVFSFKQRMHKPHEAHLEQKIKFKLRVKHQNYDKDHNISLDQKQVDVLHKSLQKRFQSFFDSYEEFMATE